MKKRDESRLFVYDTKTDRVVFDHFKNIAKFLPKESLLVLNDTKVLPARVILKKESGGNVGVLFLTNEYKEGDWGIRGMVDRKVVLGQKLYFNEDAFVEAVLQEENVFLFRPSVPLEDFFTLLNSFGITPLPPYIESKLSEDDRKERYQTVFAKEGKSVAAPTAALHFTQNVFDSLHEKNISKAFLTLEVGQGTFAPVTEVHVREKKLHREFFRIPQETLTKIRQHKKKEKFLGAVGTTVVRTLESNAEAILKGNGSVGLQGSTDIFILPPYHFKMVDYLITNFHVEGSSLRLLVEAFLEDKGAKQNLTDLYQRALEANFRFFSFGDSMLIL